MRKINKSYFALFLLLSFSTIVISQDKKIDSLKKELSVHTGKDSIRVNILNELAYNYYLKDTRISQSYLGKAENILKTVDYKRGQARNLFIKGALGSMKGNFESTIHYYQDALKLYKSINFKKGISDCYSALGVISRFQNNYKSAIEYLEKAIKIKEEIGYTKNLPSDLNFLGTLNFVIGNYPEALQYYERAVKIFEEKNNEKGIARSFESLGDIYQRQGNYPLALEYYNKSLFLKEKNTDSIGMHNILNNIGVIYDSEGYSDKAIKYYNRSLAISKRKNYKRGIARTNTYIGSLHKNKKEYSKALAYFNQALEANQEMKDLDNTSLIYNYMGSIYLTQRKLLLSRDYFKKSEDISLKIDKQPMLSRSYWGIGNTFFVEKKYDKALFYALKSKSISDKLNSLSLKRNTQYLLSNIYKATGDFKKALESYEDYKRANDSLFNKDNARKITELEYEYKYKQALDSASIRELQLTKTVKTTSENLEKSQRNLLLGVIGFLVFALLMGAVIFIQKLRNVQTKTQNIIVEQKLLRSQMTPHFIFNSLSVLQGMILNKEEKTSVTYLSKFSKLLRTILENSRHKTVVLSEELSAINSYMALQNLDVTHPFEYKLLVDSKIDKSALKIPPMLIQPFIENAIEHAFPNKKKNKEIIVELTFEGKKMVCTILDNGIGINVEKQSNNGSKSSLATTITAERLEMLSKEFNAEGSVTIENREKFGEQGTLVTLVIPYKKIDL